MPLAPGDRLQHYELIDAIGAGGMGEVWRARDTTLDREVAIKVLPQTFAKDAERRARFENEARSLAALTHPHIAAIYGLHLVGETAFLAMELVPGQSLEERMARGPVPLDETLACVGQIAQALAAAHDRGIVHRDLKPGNVMLTPAGAKLLDFGLAKITVARRDSTMTAAPTITNPLTAEGAILGTFLYGVLAPRLPH